jgi:hypothetical protein
LNSFEIGVRIKIELVGKKLLNIGVVEFTRRQGDVVNYD